MKKPKFKRGPWKFNAHDGSITDCTAGENEIALVQIEDWNVLGMGYANAHLIACAPDMYDTLEIIKRHILNMPICDPHLYGWVEENIDPLLKRARGE